MVVRQEAPGFTVRAVIFANRPPLPLTHIGPPQIPVTGLPQPILKPPEPGHPVTFSTHHGSMLVPAAPGRITRRGGKGPGRGLCHRWDAAYLGGRPSGGRM